MTGELPKGWAMVTAADAGAIQLGRQRSPKNHRGSNMKPYLRVANVFEDRIDTGDVMQMHFEPEEYERYRLVEGDVLLNEGQSPELLGRPAIYRGVPKDIAFTNSLIRFQAHEGILPEWALIVFRNHMHSGRFAQESRITTNIAHLSAKRFSTTEFPVPPTAEQARIVGELERRLSHVEAAARGTERARELLTATRRSVHNAVADGSLIGSSAAGWSVCEAGEVSEVRGGIQKQPKRKPVMNRFPFLRVANVGRGVLDLSDVHEVELFEGELERFRLERGDLLVVEGNGSVDQIGRAAMWGGAIPDCVHQNHLIRVRPGAELVPEFMELVWNSPLVIEQLKAVSSSTSGLHTLSTAKVKSVKLHVPSVVEQRALVTEAQRRLSIVDATERAFNTTMLDIRNLRRSLLASAASGQLVPQDPDDEPADVLVDRIRAERAAAAPKKKTRARRNKEAVA